MVDFEMRQILGQIVDNQMSINSRLESLIKIVTDLTNTIIKYDNSYNEEMLKSQRVEE